MTTETVSLGGREFQVPRLPIGVMKVVFPKYTRLREKAYEQDEEFMNTLCALVYDGLSFAERAAGRELKGEDFYAICATSAELTKAMQVIVKQCGAVENKEGDTQSGEPQSQIGTSA